MYHIHSLNIRSREMKAVQKIVGGPAKRTPEAGRVLRSTGVRIISSCASSMRGVCDALRSTSSMFTVSLYEHYSSFAASPHPRIMGFTGSGRGNFIDKLAEAEGARTPHGVGSRTRDIREDAVKLYDHCEYVFVDIPGFKDSVRPPIQLYMTPDWLRRNAEFEEAVESMSNCVCFSRGWTLQESLALPTLKRKTTKQIPLCSKRFKKPPVWHLKHFSPGSVGLERASSMPMDQDCIGLRVGAW
ncbi:hypothetical protein EDD15DRAFT_384097 [Pisolithus albus]|nr:hypothetical protein EDD15DRAFT_384097 [Pisolithus albus]